MCVGAWEALAADGVAANAGAGRERGFWDIDARRFGLIEYSVFDRMHVIHGSSVGGGSLHYFNGAPAEWRPLPGVGHFVDLEAPGELTNEIARVAGLGPSPQPATELTRQ